MNIRIATIAVLAAIAGSATYWATKEKNQESTPTPVSVSASTTPGQADTDGYLSYKDIAAGKKPLRPVFNMPDRYNKTRSIKEWDGKIILLNFWATWCPPCRKEMPAFIELQKKYGAKGFQVIGVALDEVAQVNVFANEIGVNYPLLVGSLNAAEISRAYGNSGGQLPYTVFINRKGELVAVKRGEISKQQTERIIRKLLNLK